MRDALQWSYWGTPLLNAILDAEAELIAGVGSRKAIRGEALAGPDSLA
jgi:hypothetical protein